MFYRNANIFCPDNQFHSGAFSVENGMFSQVLPETIPDDAVDLRGQYVIPGLIDIHIHGAAGADFSDGELGGLEQMGRYLARNGVTSFAPASVTLPDDVLSAAFSTARQYAAHTPQEAARLVGIHMEGPYFSEKKKGAQNAAYLQLPNLSSFRKLFTVSGGLIRIVDVAPELPGAPEFISAAAQLCTVSVAHTDATYEEAKTAFSAGASHLTHLFNAMPSIHHRNPGVIPAAAENPQVRAELICDGYHVHPSAVRLAFAMFGPERIVLISDSLRCCGMPEGEYTLGGQTVSLSDGAAKLPDGTLAGSATNLFDCMKNAIRYGIAPEDAIRAATLNPACAIGVQDRVGSIAPGKQADFILCRKDFSDPRVFLSGQEII